MFNTRKVIYVLTMLTAIILLITTGGCSKEDSTPPPAGDPVLSVKMVDAPSGNDGVNVEVIGLEANMGTFSKHQLFS